MPRQARRDASGTVNQRTVSILANVPTVPVYQCRFQSSILLLKRAQAALKCASQQRVPLLPGVQTEAAPIFRYDATSDCATLAAGSKVKTAPNGPLIPPGEALATPAFVRRALGTLLESHSVERLLRGSRRIGQGCFNNEALHECSLVGRYVGKSESCFGGSRQVVRLRAGRQQQGRERPKDQTTNVFNRFFCAHHGDFDCVGEITATLPDSDSCCER